MGRSDGKGPGDFGYTLTIGGVATENSGHAYELGCWIDSKRRRHTSFFSSTSFEHQLCATLDCEMERVDEEYRSGPGMR